MKRESGRYVTTSTLGEEVRAFVPYDLPPEPPISISQNTKELLEKTLKQIELLDLASQMVPNAEWFIYGFVRKEAVVSSQIEGTQATLVDLLSHEDEKTQTPDVKEVCNYLNTLYLAIKEIKSKKGVPLSLRLIKNMHSVLMEGVRGANKNPGEFRTSQNWIGGTRPGNARFVPPPPNEMNSCLDKLEKYIYSEGEVHPLIRAGLVHVQFETIHPFLDGNGRLGRLLITLLLQHWNLLQSPLLYLSLYFKRHRDEYYNRLNMVRINGDWEGWIVYYLEGVITIAKEATETARKLFHIFERDRKKIISLPKSTMPAIRLMELLPNHPVVEISRVTSLLKVTKPTAIKAVSQLTELGVLKESTARKRDRKFVYKDYVDILSEETELE
ncbi:MAG: cell filamentation protein Fic [Deltaproteobacteria bacterium RIFCSPLOWO2_02_FULL_47_10]|nr:MAG: cell filamentation protein Fic [Deltaproteobacteria bacterium RIFCSPLOWO2_02_FULL_47_10]